MSGDLDRIVLDNTFVSTLQQAHALDRVLGLWPGRWVVPLAVIDEAATWKVHGTRVTALLRRLETAKAVEITTIDPRTEGALFARLARRLGQGESAVITIAYHRGHAAALDDRRARRSCDALIPPVRWLPTERILSEAVNSGLLQRSEAEHIWQATGITDPARRIE